MTEVYTICSDYGDEYKLQFTTERSGIIADDILTHLDNAGIEVVEIGLARVRGTPATRKSIPVQEYRSRLFSAMMRDEIGPL